MPKLSTYAGGAGGSAAPGSVRVAAPAPQLQFSPPGATLGQPPAFTPTAPAAFSSRGGSGNLGGGPGTAPRLPTQWPAAGGGPSESHRPITPSAAARAPTPPPSSRAADLFRPAAPSPGAPSAPQARVYRRADGSLGPTPPPPNSRAVANRKKWSPLVRYSRMTSLPEGQTECLRCAGQAYGPAPQAVIHEADRSRRLWPCSYI